MNETKLNEDIVDEVETATLATDIASGLEFSAPVVGRAFQSMLTNRIMSHVQVEGPTAAMFFSRSNGSKKEIITASVEMELSLVETTASYEFFQDIESMMGKDGKTFLIGLLSQDLVEDIDARTLAMLDDIASVRNTLVLTAISDTSYVRKFNHISLNIVSALNTINETVKRGGTGFAVVSSKVASALMMSGDMEPARDKDHYDRDYIGKLYGYINIFVDTDVNIAGDYCLVGYKGNTSKLDSGVSYITYTHTVEVLDTYSVEEQKVIIRERSNLIRNPLDTGTGSGDSDFYTKFTVDFTDINI